MSWIRCHLLILWLSLRWVVQINLGNQVYYKGRRYVVVNGARVGQWRLAGLDNGDDGWVPSAEVRKVWSPSEMLHSFTSGRRFYMRSWYRIWRANGIEP